MIKLISCIGEKDYFLAFLYLQKILGCNILSAILEEYATTAKSSELNLIWEVHLREKKQFELSDMKKIFKLCIEILGQLIEKDFDELTLPFLKHLLSIVESILVWGFVNANYILLLLIYILNLLFCNAVDKSSRKRMENISMFYIQFIFYILH